MHDRHSRKQQQQAAGGMNRDPPQMLVAVPALEQASNLPTLLKTLREMSATVQRTLGELPPVNPSDTSQARKKTWSMRSRMGCLTCRSRHVKCDELQPRCKRCTLSDRECVYGKAARDAVAPAPGLSSADWHIKEAINYYVHVIDPMHAWHAQGDSAYQFNHEAVKIMNRRYFDGDVFAMYVLAHRLQCLYSLQCIAPRYGNISSLQPLWLRLFKQMAVVIERLNYCLTTPDSFLAFRCIRMLMYVELSFAIPTWRAHAEGFGALIKSNPRKLADLFSSDLFVVQYPLVVASMCNTTSPANNQIQNLSNWSDKDVATAYSHTGCHAFPCPTAVFQAMIRITHLRTLVAANVEAPEWPEWEKLASAAFEKIWSVDPHNWGEPYAADANDMSVLDAQIYQAAVSLYAILTLPPQLAALFPFVPRREERTASGNCEGTGEVGWETADEQVSSSTLPNSVHHTIVALGGTEAAELKPEADRLDQIHAALEQDSSRTARVRYRSRLFRLFQRSAAANLWTGSLLWPVAVLGVAFPHHKAEQVALLDHVGYLRGWPSSENGAACLYEKLVLFWDSGRRGWEQCFYEPTNVFS